MKIKTKKENGVTQIDVVTAIIVFMVGSVSVLLLYTKIYAATIQMNVHEMILGYVTSLCEEIDLESYEDITEARIEQIIEESNLPSGYNIDCTIENYADIVKTQSGNEIEDLVKKVKLDVQYTISEETTSFTINKIKIKE